MDRSFIRRRLLSANHDAQLCAKEILAADKADHPLICSLVLRYVAIRYFLELEEIHTDDLYELAEIAVAKTMAIKREKLADIDIPGTCTGASTAVSKKILLLMALCRDLGFELEPDRAVDLQTIEQLACFVESKSSECADGKGRV